MAWPAKAGFAVSDLPAAVDALKDAVKRRAGNCALAAERVTLRRAMKSET